MDVPEYSPKIGEREAEVAKKTVSSGWISPAGKKTKELEDRFEDFIGRSAIAVDSGTAALHLALEALNLPDGSEVVVPDLTYGATGLAVLEAGMKPVLGDIETDTYGIDPGSLSDCITPSTEAVIVVHMYGRPAKMDEIMEITSKNDLKVVEDAALALGAEYRGEKVGSIGDISCFSFAWNKNITTGKGGMVFADEEYIERLRSLADYGRGKNERFEFEEVGYNYLMDNIRASIGIEQFKRLDDIFERKREIFKLYRDELEGVEVEIPDEDREFVKSTPTGFYVLTDRKEELKDFLHENGVGCRDIFKPLNRMELFPAGDFRVSEKVADRGLVLPSHPDLSREEVTYVTSKVKEFFQD